MVINYAEREKTCLECVAQQITEMDPQSSVLIVDFRDPDFLAQLLAFQPETLLTFPLTARTISYIPYLMKAAFRTRVLFYRTEGIFTADTPGHLEAVAGQGRYGPCCTDGELFWGKEHAAEMANLLFNQNKLSSPTQRMGIVGYIPFGADFEAQLPHLPSEILSRLHAIPRKKVMLFLTGFQMADYTPAEIEKAQDIIPEHCPDIPAFMRDMLLGIAGANSFRNRWIRAILTTALQNPDLLLVVKPHPVEIARFRIHGTDSYEDFFSGIPNILYLKENYHIISLLKEVGALIHYGSTCVAFAYKYHVPTIFVEYPEPFVAIRDKDGMVHFDNLRLKSDYVIHIRDMAPFIQINKDNFIAKEPDLMILDILKSFFNYTPKQKTLPSKIIARILLSPTDFPYQEIDNKIDRDFFLLEASPCLPYCINVLKHLQTVYQREGNLERAQRTEAALNRISSIMGYQCDIMCKSS